VAPTATNGPKAAGTEDGKPHPDVQICMMNSRCERYSCDACVFVNTGDGKRLRLRGIYGRVVKDGRVSVGDKVARLG
jgi:hypothetical protein